MGCQLILAAEAGVANLVQLVLSAVAHIMLMLMLLDVCYSERVTHSSSQDDAAQLQLQGYGAVSLSQSSAAHIHDKNGLASHVRPSAPRYSTVLYTTLKCACHDFRPAYVQAGRGKVWPS